MSNELKAKKLIKRIEKLSSAYWMNFKVQGINHTEWCKYYFFMMRSGEKLKSMGVKYQPRSKRYPVEFKELFR